MNPGDKVLTSWSGCRMLAYTESGELVAEVSTIRYREYYYSFKANAKYTGRIFFNSIIKQFSPTDILKVIITALTIEGDVFQKEIEGMKVLTGNEECKPVFFTARNITKWKKQEITNEHQ